MQVKAARRRLRRLRAMDKFPPAEDGPHFELQSIGRTLSDLPPSSPPRRGGAGLRLVPVAVAVLALLVFVGWLLVGIPLAIS
jgi:hypothetical protein